MAPSIYLPSALSPPLLVLLSQLFSNYLARIFPFFFIPLQKISVCSPESKEVLASASAQKGLLFERELAGVGLCGLLRF